MHVAEPGVDAADLAPGTAAGGELLCVAAVIAGKGHDVLLEALATIADLSWQCLCVGSLDRDPAFAEGVAAASGAPGWAAGCGSRARCTGAELDRSYAAADLLVLASRAETYGMVVTEALARGLPVVATEVGGVPEALGHGAGGTPAGAARPARRPCRARPPRCGPGSATPGCDSPGAGRRASGGRRSRGWPATTSVARRRPGRGGAMTVEGDPGQLRMAGPARARRRRGPGARPGRAPRRHLPATGRRVIHDLGCGTGAMGRWLAPLLPGPQHWVVHDRDADLLAVAAADPPGPAADGAAVTRRDEAVRHHPAAARTIWPARR